MISKIRYLVIGVVTLVGVYFGSRAACSNGKLGDVTTEKMHETKARPYIEEAKKALKQ